MSEGFYFGCCDGPGHFIHSRHGRISEYRLPNDFPFPLHTLDGGLLPPKMPEIQGRATLVQVDGWTAISFWDRSVDARGRSNSSFIFRGEMSFEQICKASKEMFPLIWNRFGFAVKQALLEEVA